MKQMSLGILFLLFCIFACLALSAIEMPAQAARRPKLIWQGSLIFPSLKWVVKAPAGVSGKHTAKIVVIQPDGIEQEYAIYGEKNDWRMKFIGSDGGVSFGIPERGAYLCYDLNQMYKSKKFSYKIFLDEKQIAHGDFEGEVNFGYGMKDPRKDSFKLSPIQVDSSGSATDAWQVSNPRVVFQGLSLRDKHHTLPRFTAVFKFIAPDKEVFTCSRTTSNEKTDCVTFPDDFSPPFKGYKSGRYSWTTNANGRLLEPSVFDCIVGKSDGLSQVITILSPRM